jgi:hypothetical protein
MKASVLALWVAERVDRATGADNLAAHVTQGRGIEDFTELAFRTARAGSLSGVVTASSLQPFFENLESIEALAAIGGGRTLFSTFQFAEAVPGSTAFNDTLRSWLTETGKPWVDLDAEFADGDSEINFDPCHFTDAGRRRVAQVLFDAIVERGWAESSEEP